MTKEEFVGQANAWGVARMPFFFMVDFEIQKPEVWLLSDVHPDHIRFDFNGKKNFQEEAATKVSEPVFERHPVSLSDYQKKFNHVHGRLLYGDSFLTNLTIKTEVKTSASLLSLFGWSRARYRLLYDDQFLVFSPETFIKISDNHIFSYPMKGTIDASIPEAEKIILSDAKEMAEHITIVDLIRNDLSKVSKDVSVKRFRYIDHLKTNQKHLLQVSSEVSGMLDSNWNSKIGNILMGLLPAGSVSGAPKEKTLEIIQEAEGEPRGYYTGVMGIFDGKELDSAVMIRYIEKQEKKYFYRSGGGITSQSVASVEYHEAIDKVYVPIG